MDEISKQSPQEPLEPQELQEPQEPEIEQSVSLPASTKAQMQEAKLAKLAKRYLYGLEKAKNDAIMSQSELSLCLSKIRGTLSGGPMCKLLNF